VVGKRGGARTGAGRKPRNPGERRVSLSTRVSPSSSIGLRAYAESAGMSLSEALDEMLAIALQQQLGLACVAAEPQEANPPAEQRLTQELEAQRALLANIIRHAPAGILFIDKDLLVRWVNPHYLRLRQRLEADYLDRLLFEAAPEARELLTPLIETVLASGESIYRPREHAKELLAEPPAHGHVNFSLHPVFGDHHELLGVLLFNPD
jgi:hypothetical protein